jgi:ferric-dicitrate binding protein FerR (iron transport regulator)
LAAAKEFLYLREGIKMHLKTRTARRAVLLFLLALPGAAFAVSGQVMYTEGDVAWRNGTVTHDATIGDSLGPGDVIVTGARSLAVIDLANGTTLKLKEKTTLAIDSIGASTAVTLTAGAVFTTIARKLTGRFSVNTQTAVAGVRGTEFFVAYGKTIDAKPDVWLCVNSGAVEVTIPDTGQTVVVKQGLGINIVGGAQITSPKRYPWTRKLNWNSDPRSGKVDDATTLDSAYSDLLNQDYD